MKALLSFILAACIAAPLLLAQDTSPVEAKFKVYGNCGMCKKRIEKAVSINDVKFAKWDKSTKMLAVAYIPAKITLDSLQQRVAAVGHDTDRFKAPDSVYASLPGCCLYRSDGNTH
jgi:hypothetical protein